MSENLELEQYGCGSPVNDLAEDELEEIIRKSQVERLAYRGLRTGKRIVGGGKVVANIRGMGRVIDWTDTNWSPPNGGKISNVKLYVNHIPVIRQMAGIDDFVVLRNVLVAQGLMVQHATDASGNVALYCKGHEMCYHARGANAISAGCEHMHLTVNEDWTKRQLRAAAFLWHRMDKWDHVPFDRTADLGRGHGYVVVHKQGQTTHKSVSRHAGYHDRTDPGDKFWNQRDYIRHCVRYYRRRGHFAGA